jgi:RNA 3'-phosphate cyclase
MAPLGRTDDDEEVVHILQGIPHRFEVPEMKRLEPADEQTDPHLSSFGGHGLTYLRKREPRLNSLPFPRPGVDFIEVDGSRGEGGGQILRTAVAYSAVRGVPVRVTSIRAGRNPPGLRRQHVSALKVLSKAFGGRLEGAAEGSSAISFVPGRPEVRQISADMGTAASITLVLQAVVPAVALSGSRIDVELTGGTDVPWSPTFDYFQNVVRRGYAAVGIRMEADSPRRGYYPKGGGKVRATVEPSGPVTPLDLTSRGRVSEVILVSRCGGLPRHVAERQLASATSILESSGMRVASGGIWVEDSDSPGTSILAYHAADGAILGADALGSKGRPAEDVGREAASKFVEAARSGACIDSNLADMVVPLLPLAPSPSKVRIPEVTPHLESGLHIAQQFTSCRWSVRDEGTSVTVEVTPDVSGGTI